MQIDDPLVQILVQTVVSDLPHFYGGVLGARGDLVVIERIPFEVEDGPAVSTHFGRIHINTTGVLDRYDNKRTAATLFRDYRHELGVDGAEGGVVRRIFGDLYVLVADIFFVRVTIYVSVFGRSYFKWHLREKQNERD